MKTKIIIYRPAVENNGSFRTKELMEAVSDKDMYLHNVTVVEDRAIYIFREVDRLCCPEAEKLTK